MSASKRLFEGDGHAEPPVEAKRPKSQPDFQLRELQVTDCKRTNDEVHSTIELDPVAVAIWDTPQFQRLGCLRQLGTSEKVYINTNHTRFEHSLGVYQLARCMARRIHERQPLLGTTEKDILCVSLAGMLHDIGHGPFSHIYDNDFVAKVLPKYLASHPELKPLYAHVPPIPDKWCHERASLMMIDALLEHLGLRINLDRLDEPLEQVGDGVKATTMRVFHNDKRNDNPDLVLTSRDFVFVKECIMGKPLPDLHQQLGVQGFVGRPQAEKEWLYDIVSNRHSGLDVDKVDYYARDERRAMKTSGEIDKRVIEEAFVAWGACTDPTTCIRCSTSNNNDPTNAHNHQHLLLCYPEKMVPAAVSFFKKRFDLHKQIYKHKVTTAAGYMVCDILCRADPYYWIPMAPLQKGRPKLEYDALPMSRAMLDPSVFVRLKDSIIDVLSFTTDPKLQPARDLIQRLNSRKLYKCVADRSINMKESTERRIWSKTEDEIKKEMLQVRGVHLSDDGTPLELEADDFIIQRCDIHYGSKGENPLNRMRFLPKAKLHRLGEPIASLPEAFAIDESTYEAQLPRSFQENSIRVISRHPHKDGVVEHIFDQWLQENKDDLEMTADQDMQEAVVLSQETEDERDEHDDEDAQHEHNNPVAQAFAVSARHSVTPQRYSERM